MTTIITKNGVGEPAPGDLSVSEIALDKNTGDLYTKLTNNRVKKLNEAESYDDTQLKADLEAETQARIDGDADLQGQIDNIDVAMDEPAPDGKPYSRSVAGGATEGTWVEAPTTEDITYLDDRIDSIEGSISGGGGFVEAPNDGSVYARDGQAPAWVKTHDADYIDAIDVGYKNADLALQGQIDALEAYNDTGIKDDLATETQARIDGDAALQTQIDDLEAYNDEGIKADLDAEIVAREDGDAVLQNQINDLEPYDDTGIKADLATETQARIDGDVALGDEIESEVNKLQNQIDALVEEAPTSGLVYGRANGTWVEVTGGGGGGTGGAGSVNLAYDKLTPDGVTDTFDLTLGGDAREPLGATNLLVSVNGVIQEPGVAFTTSDATITFSEVPQADDVIDFIVELTNGSHWELNGVNLEYAGEGTKVIVDQFQANGDAVFMGNVGIGTDVTSSKLDVRASQNNLLRLYNTNAGGDAEIEFVTLNNASSVGKLSKISATQVGADNNGSILSFSTSPTNANTPTERMRIDATGNVGIGETSPNYPLTVKGGDRQLALEGGGTSDSSMYFTGAGNTWCVGSHKDDSGHFKIASGVGLNVNTRFTIDGAGNVGIGMTPEVRTAKEQLAEWKSRFDERLKADPKADKKAATLEITDDAFEVLPTEEAVAEWMETRAAGDKLQVAGNISATGTVSAGSAYIKFGSSSGRNGSHFGSNGGALQLNNTFTNFEPTTTGVLDLGHRDATFKDAYFSGTVNASDMVIFNGGIWRNTGSGIKFNGPVTPTDNSGANTSGITDLGSASAKWKDAHFSGTVDAGGFTVNGSPLTRVSDLIETLSTLRNATMDETQDIRESLRSAIDELISGFEQEIATMPAGDES